MSTILAAAPSPAAAAIPDVKIAFLVVTGLTTGMSIIICGFVVLTEGPSFKLTGDRDRQRFLALVSMLTAMCGVFGNGIKEGRFGKSVGQSILSFFFNWGVQIGLVVIVHNAIVRGLTARLRNIAQELLRNVSRFCLIFYLFTLPVMTPTFIALVHPKDAGVTIVSRYMNIVFVVVVETLATVTDLLLLRRFSGNKIDGKEIQKKLIKDMWIVYVAIWLSICADITAKLYRNFTGDLLPDLAITNLTISMRAIANLRYGTTLKSTRQIVTLPSQSSSLTAPTFNQTNKSGHTVTLPVDNSTFIGHQKKHSDALAMDSTDRYQMSTTSLANGKAGMV